MRKRYMDFIVFILSSVLLLISAKLFWNMGVYIDEYGISTDVINRGRFWASMDLVRLLVLVVLFIISLIRLFKPEHK